MTKAEMDLLIREVNIPMYNILLFMKEEKILGEEMTYVVGGY